MRDKARQWWARAATDHVAVNRLASEDPLPVAETLLFTAHDAGEKFLKAALLASGLPRVHTHDLDRLVREVTQIRPDLRKVQRSATILNDYGIEYRDVNRQGTREDIELALAALGEIRRGVEPILQAEEGGT